MAALAAGKLSEEDDEEQTDELEALASIYPEKMMLIDEDAGRSFELSIQFPPVRSTVSVSFVPRAANTASSTLSVTEKSETKRRRKKTKAKQRVCKFFGTSEGCRYGDRCRFFHGLDARNIAAAADVPETRVATKSAAHDTGIRLTHLLPIVLRVTFPPKYPSAQPPDFVLSSPWLMPNHRARLREQMLSLWDKGMPIVFSWIQYLESDEPSALVDCITLYEQDAQEHTTYANSAATAAFVPDNNRGSVESLIDAMVRYDRQGKANEFAQSEHSCEICFDQKPGTDFILFEASCGHYFCRECLESYVDLHLRGASPVSDLCCPSGTGRCSQREFKRLLTADEVFCISGEEARVKFERLLLQQALSSMGDIVFCPKTSCQTPTVEESENFGHCPKCRFAFCTLCFESFHPGRQCITGEEAIRIARRHNAEGKSNFGPEEQERRKRLIQTAQSLAMIKRSTKQCPSCRSAVSKTRGCNKMSCPCGTKFCYSCSKDITAEGYDHFGPNSCVLFDDAAIRQWEMEMAGFQYNPEFHFGLQVRRAGVGAAAAGADQEVIWLHCPRCRQRNVRGENENNQIRCWACQTKFCACCRGVIMNTASHYERGKRCRQHGGPVAGK